jgi:hypothetical protein
MAVTVLIGVVALVISMTLAFVMGIIVLSVLKRMSPGKKPLVEECK